MGGGAAFACGSGVAFACGGGAAAFAIVGDCVVVFVLLADGAFGKNANKG